MAQLLGSESRKIHPKLRMIANGSTEVNAVRAEQCAAVAVEAPKVAEALPILRGDEPVIRSLSALPALPKPPKLQQLPEDVLVNVFIETQDVGEDLPEVLKDRAHRANLVTTTVQINRLPEIAQHPRVLHIELGESLATPTPEISHHGVAAPDVSRWRFGAPAQHQDGAGVLIGIIDVQGFDFAHPDFLDGNMTRFVRIWDQGGTARPSPHTQDPKRYGKPFDFGAEFRQEHLNKALAAARNAAAAAPGDRAAVADGPVFSWDPCRQHHRRQSRDLPKSPNRRCASLSSGGRHRSPQVILRLDPHRPRSGLPLPSRRRTPGPRFSQHQPGDQRARARWKQCDQPLARRRPRCARAERLRRSGERWPGGRNLPRRYRLCSGPYSHEWYGTGPVPSPGHRVVSPRQRGR